jgi:hypothetical protein
MATTKKTARKNAGTPRQAQRMEVDTEMAEGEGTEIHPAEGQEGARMGTRAKQGRIRPPKGTTNGEPAGFTVKQTTPERASKMVGESVRPGLPAGEQNLGKLEQVIRWAVQREENLDRLYEWYQSARE